MIGRLFALGSTCLFALVAVTAPASAQAGAAGTPKFAYVDSRVIIDKAPGRAAAESLFNKEFEAARNQVQRMQDTLQAMMTAYQKRQASLSAVNRELEEKGIRDKQQQFENRANLLDAQMQQRQAELVQPMMNQIREVLEAVRNEEGYTFIFDIGAQSGVIVAADKSLDITDKVVARLKPVPVTGAAGARPDSTRAAAVKPAPAGIKKPPTP